MNIMGALDPLPDRQGLGANPSCHLGGSAQRRRLHESHARNRSELTNGGAYKALESANACEQRPRLSRGVAPAIARPQNQSDELDITQRTWSQTFEAFAWAVVTSGAALAVGFTCVA